MSRSKLQDPIRLWKELAMSKEIKETRNQPGAPQSAHGRDHGPVPFDELKRQLGLSLIEAARDQFGSEAHASLLHRQRW